MFVRGLWRGDDADVIVSGAYILGVNLYYHKVTTLISRCMEVLTNAYALA